MQPVSLFQDSASPVSSQGPGQRAAHGQPQGGSTFPHRLAPSSGPQTNLPRGKGRSCTLVSFIVKSFRCVTGPIITGQPRTRPRGLGTGTRCTLPSLCALSTLPVRPREPLLNSSSPSPVFLHHSPLFGSLSDPQCWFCLLGASPEGHCPARLFPHLLGGEPHHCTLVPGSCALTLLREFHRYAGTSAPQ